MTQHLLVPLRSGDLLNRILEQPGMVASIQHLDPSLLKRLVDHIGLEDAAEIVAMASTEQLHRVFDEDLWHNRQPGEEEVFDADRFVLWLEVLQESGAGVAAQKVARFDEDILTLVLSRHLLVLDHEALAARVRHNGVNEESFYFDKALESALCCELNEFLVVSRNHRSWESLLSLLIELNEVDYPMLTRLLERCAYISSELIEDNGGLYDVLTGEEMLAADVAAEREGRRQKSGYVTPAAAAAFLRQARTKTQAQLVQDMTLDHDSRRYFRMLENENQVVGEGAKALSIADAPDAAEQSHFFALLREAQVVASSSPIKQLEMHGSQSRQLALSQAMQWLQDRADATFNERLAEISYLANVLMVGCSFQGRRFRPVEAAEAAVATCQLGVEYLLDCSLAEPTENDLDKLLDFIESNHLIRLFKLGWWILRDRVSIAAAQSLLLLMRKHNDDSPNANGRRFLELAALTEKLETLIKAAQPWQFVPAMDDLLGYLDNELLSQLLSLIREYPTVTLNGVHWSGMTDSSIISSRKQIQAIETFLANLKAN
jgi:hypothetical protein